MDVGAPSPEQGSPPDRSMTPDGLAGIFVATADTLADDVDLDRYGATLAENAAQIAGATCAGLYLDDAAGTLRHAASSTTSDAVGQLFELSARHGPGAECHRSGEVVAAADLEVATDRWPEFVSGALDAGLRSAQAIPLRHRTAVIGSLTLLHATPGDLDPTAATLVQCLAGIAAIGLLRQRATRRSEALNLQLQQALNSRIAIEQAKGVLSHTRGVDVDTAFDLMRRYARARRYRLTDVARAVVSHPESHPELTGRP